MNLFLDDSQGREALHPFTLTRHTADIRVGILTIREKWEKLTGKTICTEKLNNDHKYLEINSSLIPSIDDYTSIIESGNGANSKKLEYPWQIFQYNDWALRQDFKLITWGRQSAEISQTNQLINPSAIFIEEGAKVEYSILNAMEGPIYIGKNAVMMEGNLVRGPFALCEGAVLKMGSRIYGATTIGPYCVAGGEIKNSVLFGYSNKGHDGYLGDSVIGEWCNLGAGTSNSNVKNTGGAVRYINGAGANPVDAGNKGGLLMGDYSRAAINTSFNTATVVGVCCNIFGNELPEKYIADFSWGKARYEFDKVLKDIENWKKMKGKELTDNEITLLEKLYSSKK